MPHTKQRKFKIRGKSKYFDAYPSVQNINKIEANYQKKKAKPVAYTRVIKEKKGYTLYTHPKPRK